MSTYGPQEQPTIGGTLMVAADDQPVRHASGVTIDWSTVAALGSDTTYNDGTSFKTGVKVLRYGQVLCRITASGKYGPYASGASDGRQTLTRGQCVIVNTTWPEVAVGVATDFPDVIEGGLCWKERILMGGAGQPTVSALEAVLPLMRYVEA